MAEYIERQALIKAYVDLCLARSRLAKSRKGAAFFQGDLLPETELTDKEWMRLINATPAVDAVEVVRCKDCRFCKQNMINKKLYCFHKHWIYDHYFGHEVTEEHFCGYGKRREDDG